MLSFGLLHIKYKKSIVTAFLMLIKWPLLYFVLDPDKSSNIQNEIPLVNHSGENFI
jgi:hypothetical protein